MPTPSALLLVYVRKKDITFRTGVRETIQILPESHLSGRSSPGASPPVSPKLRDSRLSGLFHHFSPTLALFDGLST